MLNVADDRLVVEQKGVYSVERFLTSRRIMYWQVYLHKTVVAAEQMLILTLQRARDLCRAGQDVWCPPGLSHFLKNAVTSKDFAENRNELLHRFAMLDDTDITTAVKAWQHHPDRGLAYLSYGLVNRRLFRLEFANEPFPANYLKLLRKELRNHRDLPEDADSFLVAGEESNSAYTLQKEEIMILSKNGEVVPMSQVSDFGLAPRTFRKYFLCYPKEISAGVDQQRETI